MSVHERPQHAYYGRVLSILSQLPRVGQAGASTKTNESHLQATASEALIVENCASLWALPTPPSRARRPPLHGGRLCCAGLRCPTGAASPSATTPARPSPCPLPTAKWSCWARPSTSAVRILASLLLADHPILRELEASQRLVRLRSVSRLLRLPRSLAPQTTVSGQSAFSELSIRLLSLDSPPDTIDLTLRGPFASTATVSVSPF